MNFKDFMDLYGDKKVYFDQESDSGSLAFNGFELEFEFIKNTNCENTTCVKFFWRLEYSVKDFEDVDLLSREYFHVFFYKKDYDGSFMNGDLGGKYLTFDKDGNGTIHSEFPWKF